MPQHGVLFIFTRRIIISQEFLKSCYERPKVILIFPHDPMTWLWVGYMIAWDNPSIVIASNGLVRRLPKSSVHNSYQRMGEDHDICACLLSG